MTTAIVIGCSDLYMPPAGVTTAVLKVGNGTVQEIGIANTRLIRTRRPINTSCAHFRETTRRRRHQRRRTVKLTPWPTGSPSLLAPFSRTHAQKCQRPARVASRRRRNVKWLPAGTLRESMVG
jgi:hypothetical protein